MLDCAKQTVLKNRNRSSFFIRPLGSVDHSDINYRCCASIEVNKVGPRRAATTGNNLLYSPCRNRNAHVSTSSKSRIPEVQGSAAHILEADIGNRFSGVRRDNGPNPEGTARRSNART